MAHGRGQGSGSRNSRNNSGSTAFDNLNKINFTPNFNLTETVSAALKIPGVRINRESYLRSELSKSYSEKVVALAVSANPAYAGICRANIDKIADEAIAQESKRVTALSFAASLPGGAYMPAAVAADTTQFFASVLRIMQKLAYLYGFPELTFKEGELDEETKNQVMLFLGVMFGVHEANAVVLKAANALAQSVSKNLSGKALSQGIVYPMVKKAARMVGVRMTKQIFADSVGSFVPLIGGVVSGGITYVSFNPRAKKLQECFRQSNLSSAQHYHDLKIACKNEDDYIDVEYEEIVE